MSIKRAKAKSSGSSSKDDDFDPWAKPKAPEVTWEQATEGKADDAFLPYSMDSKFAVGQLIAHSKFGKGLITEVTKTSAEVLFQDGKKRLGHTG